MRLVTFVGKRGGERIGALVDNDKAIVDLAAGQQMRRGSESEIFRDMLALIDGGPSALDEARTILEAANSGTISDAMIPAADVKLLAPVPVPRQMRDFLCFEEHYRRAREMRFRRMAGREPDPEAAFQAFKDRGDIDVAKVWYEQPIYYKCNRFSVVGPDTDVRWPSYTELLDYELEIGAFLWSGGVNIKAEQAGKHIFGYTIFNDISARDAQSKEMQGQLGPAKGKDFDTGNVMGPCLVTADEVGDPYDLTMRARVNGEEWSHGTSASMHWKFEDLIEWASRDETLHPGEFLGSGTVGTGCGLELDRWIAPGDVIELEVEKIGVLRNTFVRPS